MDVEMAIRNRSWSVQAKPTRDGSEFIAMIVGDLIPACEPPMLRRSLGWGPTMRDAIEDAYALAEMYDQ